MKKVKQISLDIVVSDSVDGYVLAEKVRSLLEQKGYKVVGAGFNYDATVDYIENYSELLES